MSPRRDAHAQPRARRRPRAPIGELLVAFVNRVSHPRGRALRLFTSASVTVDQAILMNFTLAAPGSTPSSLAATMNISLSSVSQMIERLVQLGHLARAEDPDDRRRKTITVTASGRSFLRRLRRVRAEEFAAGIAALTDATRQRLESVLTRALEELGAAPTHEEKDE